MTTIAVLAGEGLDSGVLLDDLANPHGVCFPLYIESGLSWEIEECQTLERSVEGLNHSRVSPPVVLPLPDEGLYGNHWRITGAGVLASGVLASKEEGNPTSLISPAPTASGSSLESTHIALIARAKKAASREALFDSDNLCYGSWRSLSSHNT